MSALGLDPLFWATVRVYCFQVLELVQDEETGVFLSRIGRRPIRKIQLLGNVVHIRDVASKTMFGIDDGTGVITCLLWDPKIPSDTAPDAAVAHYRAKAMMVEASREKINLGAHLRCQGRIEMYEGEMQVIVDGLQAVSDPNEELLHWLEAIDLSRRYYHVAQPVSGTQPTARRSAHATEETGDAEDLPRVRVMEFIHRLLQDGRETFKKSEVIRSEILLSHFITDSKLKGTGSTAVIRARAAANINKEFGELLLSGDIVEVDPVDCVYCLPQTSLDLAPLILAFLQQRSKDGHGCVTFQEIQEHIGSTSTVYGADWKRIHSAIDRLVADSKVYEVEPSSYSLV